MASDSQMNMWMRIDSYFYISTLIIRISNSRLLKRNIKQHTIKKFVFEKHLSQKYNNDKQIANYKFKLRISNYSISFLRMLSWIERPISLCRLTPYIRVNRLRFPWYQPGQFKNSIQVLHRYRNTFYSKDQKRWNEV